MPKQSKQETLLINKAKSHLSRQDKLTLEIQSKSCREYENIKDMVYCRPCIDTDDTDECLFKDFRAFKRDKSGLHFGYYFPNAIQEISPLSRTSKRYNSTGPYNAADRNYLKSKLKQILKADIVQDKPTDKRKKVILRKDFQQYRHLCDVCLTSIFNYHYVCPVCSIEICTACYTNWNKKPLTEDSKKDQCVADSRHPRALFMTCQKYSTEEMNTVEMEVDNFALDSYMQEASELQLVETDQVAVEAEKTAVEQVNTTVEVARTVAEETAQTEVQVPTVVSASVVDTPDRRLTPLSPNSDDQITSSPSLKHSGDTTLNNLLSSPLLSQQSSSTSTPAIVDSKLFSGIVQSDAPCLTDTSSLPSNIDGSTLARPSSVHLQHTAETSKQLPRGGGKTNSKRSRSYYESDVVEGSSKGSNSNECSSSSNIGSSNNNDKEDFVVTEETDISLPVRITQSSTLDVKKFQRIWAHKDPLMVEGCLEKCEIPWTPTYFGDRYGNQEIEVIDCEDFSTHMSTAKEFFESYQSEEKLDAYCKKLGTSRVIKIKDWPPKLDFKEVFGDVYNDYMNNILPVPEYCSEGGFFNLSNRLPEEYMPPDLGPKMFISQASDPSIPSCTKLHCDMADAVNVMCYSAPSPVPPSSKRRKTTVSVTTATTSPPKVAAVWDIFASKDLEKLRRFIKGRNKRLNINDGLDPVLSESTYLKEKDLKDLNKKYGVKPFRFFQKAGDCVFVPAGCAHQVLNVAGSIKCAYDFLSPETLDMSHLITSQFHDIKLEDKLQVKSTMLFTWKSLSST